MSIRVDILGYGNLGRGVECAVEADADMQLVAVILHAARSVDSKDCDGRRTGGTGTGAAQWRIRSMF